MLEVCLPLALVRVAVGLHNNSPQPAALCRTPVLHATGLTVTIGVACAFLLACALAPRRAGAS